MPVSAVAIIEIHAEGTAYTCADEAVGISESEVSIYRRLPTRFNL